MQSHLGRFQLNTLQQLKFSTLFKLFEKSNYTLPGTSKLEKKLHLYNFCDFQTSGALQNNYFNF
jgi:hypothetical protein